jgi:hypothetical protein
LLTGKMYERLAADRADMTMVVASGVGIGMGGETAYRAWLRGQAPAPALGPENAGAIARQAATIGRLQSLLAHQPNPGMRDAIRIKKPD